MFDFPLIGLQFPLNFRRSINIIFCVRCHSSHIFEILDNEDIASHKKINTFTFENILLRIEKEKDRKTKKRANFQRKQANYWTNNYMKNEKERIMHAVLEMHLSSHVAIHSKWIMLFGDASNSVERDAYQTSRHFTFHVHHMIDRMHTR